MLYADIIIAVKLVHCLFAIKHENGNMTSVVVSILRSSRAFVEKLPLLNGKRTNPLDIIRPQREPNKNGCNARNPSAHCIPSAVLHISLFVLLSLFIFFIFIFLSSVVVFYGRYFTTFIVFQHSIIKSVISPFAISPFAMAHGTLMWQPFISQTEREFT